MNEGEKWIDKYMKEIFSTTHKEEFTIHCTLDSLMRLTKLNKIEALHIIKRCGRPLEIEGWYEITLDRGKSGG